MDIIIDIAIIKNPTLYCGYGVVFIDKHFKNKHEPYIARPFKLKKVLLYTIYDILKNIQGKVTLYFRNNNKIKDNINTIYNDVTNIGKFIANRKNYIDFEYIDKNHKFYSKLVRARKLAKNGIERAINYDKLKIADNNINISNININIKKNKNKKVNVAITKIK